MMAMEGKSASCVDGTGLIGSRTNQPNKNNKTGKVGTGGRCGMEMPTGSYTIHQHATYSQTNKKWKEGREIEENVPIVGTTGSTNTGGVQNRLNQIGKTGTTGPNAMEKGTGSYTTKKHVTFSRNKKT